MTGFYEEQVFPVVTDLLTRSIINHRKKMLKDLAGEVLEIGVGTGSSFLCYPKSVQLLWAIEPSPAMLKKAEARVNNLPFRVKLKQGGAENLPLEDNSCDAVVSFLTLCTVKDLDGVLSEIARILKPGGRFVFIEHVGQPKGSLMRSLQDRINPIWQKVACGCQLNRDTLDRLKQARFQLLETKHIGYEGFPNIVSPLVRGIAVFGGSPD